MYRMPQMPRLRQPHPRHKPRDARRARAKSRVGSPGDVGFNPSASKTDLLFACTYPFGRSLPEATSGSERGSDSAFHEGLEVLLKHPKSFTKKCAKAIAKKWDVDVDELWDRCVEAWPIVWAWLQGKNMWGLNFTKAGLQLEQSVAYNPQTGEARLLPDGPGEAHDYPGRREGEICGTVDVASVFKEDLG